jgi:hypothetical protein
MKSFMFSAPHLVLVYSGGEGGGTNADNGVSGACGSYGGQKKCIWGLDGEI